MEEQRSEGWMVEVKEMGEGACLDELGGHAAALLVAVVHEALEVDVQELKDEVELLVGMDDVEQSGHQHVYVSSERV